MAVAPEAMYAKPQSTTTSKSVSKPLIMIRVGPGIPKRWKVSQTIGSTHAMKTRTDSTSALPMIHGHARLGRP